MAVQEQVRTVLVIAHDHALRGTLRQMLEAAGYEFFGAADTVAASAVVAEHRIDLVISELATDTRPTEAMLEALREKRPLLRTAIVAGDAGPVALRAADLLGAQAIFTQPLKHETVVSKVRELLTEEPARY